MKFKRQVPGVRCQVSGKKFPHPTSSCNLKPRTYNLRGNPRAGFTLLIAALISSVVLSLGISIFEIARKQVSLSSMGRESQFAFYAADTGSECALYWDVRYSLFGTSTSPVFQSGITDPKCDGQSLNIDTTGATSYPYTISFEFAPTGKCSIVKVTKCGDAECVNYSNIHTIIHADGFNTDCGSVSTSPRALQRSVELRY
jgi:hypothetical protein